MRIIFIGCVQAGLKCLKQILDDKWEVKAIFTLAKRYAGRTSGFVDFSPIAAKYKIALYKIKNINTQINIDRIKRINPDLIIICGWQRLVSEKILKILPKGTISFHSSLLPRYRGRAPVNWAIINGEKKTGITMFYCDKEADTGDIIAQQSFPITLNDTCGTVYDKVAKAACGLIHKYLPRIKAGTVKIKKNRSIRHRFWPKRNPEDGRIQWNKSSLAVHNWIRALTRPYPGAFTYYDGEKVFIWKSKLNSRRKITKHKPGEIIKISGKEDQPLVLVATADKPIWITDIRKETGRLINNFKEGNSFI